MLVHCIIFLYIVYYNDDDDNNNNKKFQSFIITFLIDTSNINGN